MLAAFDHRRYLIPFRSLLLPHIFTDTLVIGGGVAGMRAAIEAAENGAGKDGGDVIMLAKDEVELSSTAWAQGGIAAAHGPDDETTAHFDDTMTAGAGLCDADAVRIFVDEGPGVIEELLEWGMRFDRTESGALDYGREGAHGRDRILHADGAATGRELVRCLHARVRAAASIRVFDRCFALDLLTIDGNGERGAGRVLGAITRHPKFGLQIIWAKATILATGGAGQVYRETTNPKVATGDGLAMAYRAGAVVGDLELVQFHPTTLYVAGASRTLISEAVRGAGARLVDREGVRFMPEYHDLADLAPRDVVSRAIVDRLARTQEPAVYLDARHLGPAFFRDRFPSLARELETFDLDPGTDLVPVHPSAHYSIGGVWTDLDGRTSLDGLIACGETAAFGLHGANRLASNSLLEGLVFGRRAGRAAAAMGDAAIAPRKIVSAMPDPEHAELDLVDVASSLRSAMWRNVGIERTGRKLDDVQEMFDFWGRYTMDMVFDDPAGWEVQNLLMVGALITRAARRRVESRGVHCRVDFPQLSPDLAGHLLWRVGAADAELRPVAGARGGDAHRGSLRVIRRPLVLALVLATAAAGCETYRIEYRRRPAYYDRLVDAPLPSRVEYEDGTVAVFSREIGPPSSSSVFSRTADGEDEDGEAKPFRLREEGDDGEVILRAFLPEHVIAHTLNALRYEEYEPFWEQLVSERAKIEYAAEGKGYEEFRAHLSKHRLALAKMFNRMRIGMATHETVVENIGGGMLECRFWPQVAVLFEFKKVVLVREDFGLKLLRIE